MKIILSSRRHHYLARISIFLILLALIAGIVGCNFTPFRRSLGISSTEGGSVTQPGEGMFTLYSAGDVVPLLAEADEGYHFVNWTGNVDTIADIYAASTTITMSGDYSIKANFEPG